MIDLDAIFAEPKVPIVAVIVPTGENQNSPEARRSEPTVPTESELINGDRVAILTSANPLPCSTCGSAIALLSAGGATSCPACEPHPAVIVRKLLIVVVAGRYRWADYDAELKTKRPNV